MFISKKKYNALVKRIADLERQVQESSCSFYAERSMDMFESKKRFKELEKRIADLEMQVQGQQNVEVKIDDKMLYSVVGKSTLSIDAKQITAQVQ